MSTKQKLKNVLVKGNVVRIYDQGPNEAGAKWWPEDYKVSLKTSSGTFHMFFLTKKDLRSHSFLKGEEVVVRGRLWDKEVKLTKRRILLDVERVAEDNLCGL